MNRIRTIACMVLLTLGQMSAAGAPMPTHYRLTLVVYTSATGNKFALGSYVASFHVPVDFTTAADCEAAGDKSIGADGYQGQVLADGSRALPGYFCDEVKG